MEVIWVEREGAIFLREGLDSESVICPTTERVCKISRRSSAQSSWPGYVPAIHVFSGFGAVKTWMPGTRLHKAGHDDRFHVRHSAARSRASTACPVHIAHRACPQPYPPKHTLTIQGFAGLFPQGCATSARLDGYIPGLCPRLRRGQRSQCGMGFIRSTCICFTV
jgi:hypothetical protein